VGVENGFGYGFKTLTGLALNYLMIDMCVLWIGFKTAQLIKKRVK